VLHPPPNSQNPNGIEETRTVNNEVAQVKEEYPDWVPAATGTVEPSYGKEVALEEIDRIMEDLELDGVMWHNRWQKATPDAPIMYDMIERAAEHDATVVLHALATSTINDPWRVFRMIEDFPDVTFLVLDIFSSTNQAEYAEYMAPNYDNVWFDTAASPMIGRKIENFTEHVGDDQLVFATDFYHTMPTRRALEMDAVNNSNLDEDQKQKLLVDNLRDVFDF